MYQFGSHPLFFLAIRVRWSFYNLVDVLRMRREIAPYEGNAHAQERGYFDAIFTIGDDLSKNAMLPGVYQNSGARLERLEDTSSLPTSKN